jgi:hypothetical protein
MYNRTTSVSEDRSYKSSSPDKPQRRFLVETAEYRWEVLVSRYVIKETGTPVFRAVTPEGYSAYGMTANEAVNDVAGIMERAVPAARPLMVSFESVRYCLDPMDAVREELKIAETFSKKPLWKRLLTSAG